MLQTIREHTQGWIAGIIISLIILSFALWGVHSYFTGENTNPAIASVNGVAISKNQFSMAYERLKRQVQFNSNLPFNLKDEAGLKNSAMQALIQIEVLKQNSLTQGFTVSDRQVDHYLQNMPEFQSDGHFSIDRLQQILSRSQLTTGEFLELIRTNLLIDQPKLGIVFTSFALPDETHKTIAIVNQERDIQYIAIPLDMSLKVNISPQQIESFYKEHLNDFKTPEQIKVDYLELSKKELMTNISPSEKVLVEFYKENVRSYLTPPTWRVEDIFITFPEGAKQSEIDDVSAKVTALHEQLQKGENFAKLAKKYNQQFANKGFMQLSQFPNEIQDKILALNEFNPLSPPIKTKLGFYIIKLIEKKEPATQAFEQVKNEVKTAYQHQQAEEKMAELKEKLADLTYEHPDSLEKASQALNLPIKTSDFFSRGKPGKGIAQYNKIRNTAFSNEVLTLRNNSDVIQTDPDTLVVIRVNSYNPSNLLPLNSISKTIEEKLRKVEVEKQTFNLANQIKTKLETGEDPAKIANLNQFQLHDVGYIGHYSTKVDSAILETAFRLANPSMQNKKAQFGVTKLPTGYAIVILKGVKEGVLNDKKQYEIFSEQVQSSNGLYEYELYKLAKIKEAKIKIEEG